MKGEGWARRGGGHHHVSEGSKCPEEDLDFTVKAAVMSGKCSHLAPEQVVFQSGDLEFRGQARTV